MAQHDCYDSDNLMSYYIAIAFIEILTAKSGISERQKRKLLNELMKRKGIPKTSVFSI